MAMTATRDISNLVSIVLPVRDEGDHIRQVLGEYVAALDRANFDFEIIAVVNGKQRDSSREECESVAVADPRVRVHTTEQGGWGWAVRQGLLQSRGDCLCYTNCARTRAEDLLLMLLYARAYPGVVVKANRKIRASMRRRLGSVLYNFECRTLFDLPSWDVNGTPKVFPRSLGRLMELTRNDDLIDLEFVSVCARQNYPILEVPIISTTRRGGKSTTNIVSAVRMYAGVINMYRGTRKAL